MLVALVVAALLLGSGCGDDEVEAGDTTSTSGPTLTTDTVPARSADVTGIVRVDDASDPALVEASDPYFEGMGLLRGDPVIVDAATAEVLEAFALEDGDEVAVWTEGACAESYPVQCEILVIQVRR